MQNCYQSQRQRNCPGREVYAEASQKPIAMAYVPCQRWERIYDLKKGFCNGTIFEELYKPFQGTGGRC